MSFEKITIKNCSEEKELTFIPCLERLREILTYSEIGILGFIYTMPNQTCTKEDIYRSSPKDSKKEIDQWMESLKQKNIILISEVE